MPRHTFESRNKCYEFLSEETGLQPGINLNVVILEALVDASEYNHEPNIDSPFKLKIGCWAIKDEEIDLFSTITAVGTSMATAGFMLAGANAAVITGVVLALVDVFRKIWRCGVTLNIAESSIISVLKIGGKPKTAAEILRELPPNDEQWTDQSVVEVLKGLTEKLTKGGPVAFVQEMQDGRWTLKGV